MQVDSGLSLILGLSLSLGLGPSSKFLLSVVCALNYRRNYYPATSPKNIEITGWKTNLTLRIRCREPATSG